MKLSADEKTCLENLYLHYGVSTDRLPRVPETLQQMAQAFERLSGRYANSNDLLRYMINRRKKHDWPMLGNPVRRSGSGNSELAKPELELLRRIYVELDMASDELLYAPRYGERLAERFAQRGGHRYSAACLVAAILRQRKCGNWPYLRK